MVGHLGYLWQSGRWIRKELEIMFWPSASQTGRTYQNTASPWLYGWCPVIRSSRRIPRMDFQMVYSELSRQVGKSLLWRIVKEQGQMVSSDKGPCLSRLSEHTLITFHKALGFSWIHLSTRKGGVFVKPRTMYNLHQVGGKVFSILNYTNSHLTLKLPRWAHQQCVVFLEADFVLIK